MHWHHAKTVLGLRRHTEGARRGDELNEAQQQRQQRQRRGHWLIDKQRREKTGKERKKGEEGGKRKNGYMFRL